MKKILSILRNPWITKVYLVALFGGVVYVLFSQRGQFVNILHHAKPHMIALAMLPYFFVVGVINPYLHSIAYKEIGSAISFWQAFRIFHLSRIGNYLPGRVWFASNYYLFSKKLNIDAERIAKNFVVLNALLFMVGSLCSLPVISLLHPAMQKLLILFPFLMLVLIHPKVLNLILKPLLRNNRGRAFRHSFLTKISILYLFAYVILGIGLYLCVSAFQAVGLSHLPLVIAAASSSLVIGLLAVFAPAGIGVSEGISAAILSQIIPLNIAVMVVVSLRLVMVVIDFACALVSAVSVAREEKTAILRRRRTDIYHES